MEDEERTLECPKCGGTGRESAGEEYVFICEDCGNIYDLVVCQECDAWYGSTYDNECPLCGWKPE